MKIVLPQISSNAEKVSNLKKLIKSDATLHELVVHDEDISRLRAKGFTANEVRLTKINATEAILEKTSFLDVELLNCELVASVLSESSWQRALAKGSLCSGLQIQMSSLKDVVFDSCKLNLANFRFSKLTNVNFKDCVLDGADFYSAELNDTTFHNCSMVKTEFSGSKLKKVDLRTSDIIQLLGVGDLKGAIIDPVQLVALAPIFADQLGIEVSHN